MSTLPAQILLALAGGVCGAAVGGFGAFILCGISSLIGVAVLLAGGGPAYQEAVTWGAFLGPHTAFAGAVAAAAFAARRGKLASGRDIVTPLYGLDSPLVLAVGGAFGAAGFLLKLGLDRLCLRGGVPWGNTIALSIVLSSLVVRLVFGRGGLFGPPAAGRRFFRPVDRAAAFPWCGRPLLQILVAAATAAAALAAGHALPQAFGLVFGFSALSLLFLALGGRVPVTLHIAWSVEYLGFWSRDVGWGLIVALLATVVAEAAARLFLLHGDTHIDPPALTTALMFTLCPLLAVSGALRIDGPYSLLLAPLVAAAAWTALHTMQRGPAGNEPSA